ncbi:hypothetical protein [Vibrio sp. MEBiC08052]|uniref:hypothetical protein n=1 Tax=Vibrio sp. MEBiC08052 TaxID=1761910 RepID=UPI0007406D7E|nr:hypothetical protein [Vibrio sp. MEBiC08052]KUI98904.1 hypothetical protein VRK_22340 [Vibrio sp. MEBiC08052]
MSYTLTETSDVMKIKEQEYSSAGKVQFTAFTSCIGILAKKKDKSEVIGIHLVMMSKDEEWFDKTAAQTVKNCLTTENYDSSDVLLIGCLSLWESDDRTKAGYAELKKLIQPTHEYQLADGIYGGEIESGKVELTY